MYKKKNKRKFYCNKISGKIKSTKKNQFNKKNKKFNNDYENQ